MRAQPHQENFPLAAPKFEEVLAETGVREDDRMTVSPARIRKLESRSFKTESGIEIKIRQSYAVPTMPSSLSTVPPAG